LIDSVIANSRALNYRNVLDRDGNLAYLYNDKAVIKIEHALIRYQNNKQDLEQSFEFSPFQFHHGLAPIAHTWPAIENLFEEIMEMDLKPTQSKQESEKRLTEFYAKAAELVWLIGTTQPLKRGSGTVAEVGRL